MFKPRKFGILLLGICAGELSAGMHWTVDSQKDWEVSVESHLSVEISGGALSPVAENATFRSQLKRFKTKRSATQIVIEQSPEWLNWQPVSNIGPVNLADAPVLLQVGPGDYWMFGRYSKRGFDAEFVSREASLDGFDVPLKTTGFPNQFDAPGGLKKSLGGYHAWQSRDMVNWVHHGPVSEHFSRWVTTAEYVDGKAYIYYDFPNDQDPHLYIDADLTDGLPGENMGLAFKDPSDGSDVSFIRDLEGDFHVIYEDWSPIDASKHSWDSPLAGHAVSRDGIKGFEILQPAVDERTTPTGKFAEFLHPHWHKEDPQNYPGKPYTGNKAYHGIKPGQSVSFSKYEIHTPEQDAYGDWATICIGGQYYLFGDFHPAGKHGRQHMSVAWFTSANIYSEPFTYCGHIGKGHPDPDVMFANGQFYLATQQNIDYVSTGPWVESVEIRFGVDTDDDGFVDQWTDWQFVHESYDYVEGFSKQVAKTPAKLDLSSLPAAYGFQYEVKLVDTTENLSKPVIDSIRVSFE